MKDLSFDPSENTINCNLSGRFGTDTNETFSDRLHRKIEECKDVSKAPGNLKVCMDLKNVSYIASSFIRTCVSVSKRLSQENFKIINATPVIKKTFKIAGLDDVLNVS